MSTLILVSDTLLNKCVHAAILQVSPLRAPTLYMHSSSDTQQPEVDICCHDHSPCPLYGIDKYISSLLPMVNTIGLYKKQWSCSSSKTWDAIIKFSQSKLVLKGREFRERLAGRVVTAATKYCKSRIADPTASK